jgi:hypothetical protein
MRAVAGEETPYMLTKAVRAATKPFYKITVERCRWPTIGAADAEQ